MIRKDYLVQSFCACLRKCMHRVGHLCICFIDRFHATAKAHYLCYFAWTCMHDRIRCQVLARMAYSLEYLLQEKACLSASIVMMHKLQTTGSLQENLNFYLFLWNEYEHYSSWRNFISSGIVCFITLELRHPRWHIHIITVYMQTGCSLLSTAVSGLRFRVYARGSLAQTTCSTVKAKAQQNQCTCFISALLLSWSVIKPTMPASCCASLSVSHPEFFTAIRPLHGLQCLVFKKAELW